MKTSNSGVNFIASFEQCKLSAYKNPGERCYTIGYGHYGIDVKSDMKITKVQALAYLKTDLATAEKYVNTYVKSFKPNQNQYDALVSYCYNRGPKGLKQLCDASKTAEDFSNNIVTYWGSNVSCKNGLIKRRQAEQALFNKSGAKVTYPVPTSTLRKGSKGAQVKWVQTQLNKWKAKCVDVDGDFGAKTEVAIKSYQTKKGLIADGIVGAKTIAKLKTEK